MVPGWTRLWIRIDADGELAQILGGLIDTQARSPAAANTTSTPRPNWLRANSAPRVGSDQADGVSPTVLSIDLDLAGSTLFAPAA